MIEPEESDGALRQRFYGKMINLYDPRFVAAALPTQGLVVSRGRMLKIGDIVQVRDLGSRFYGKQFTVTGLVIGTSDYICGTETFSESQLGLLYAGVSASAVASSGKTPVGQAPQFSVGDQVQVAIPGSALDGVNGEIHGLIQPDSYYVDVPNYGLCYFDGSQLRHKANAVILPLGSLAASRTFTINRPVAPIMGTWQQVTGPVDPSFLGVPPGGSVGQDGSPRVPCSFCSTECSGLRSFVNRRCDWRMCDNVDCNEAHHICAEWLETGGIDDSDALRRDALRKAVRIREAKRRY